MIPGLERFREFFDGFEEHYALIGGVAAMQWLEDADMKPRATKDFDIVLIFESLNSQFLKQFWGFVKHGGYSNLQGSTGRRVYYRFTQPQRNDYPSMLEVFSRVPDGLGVSGTPAIVPIPAGEDASSLSAILMDDDYYAIVREHREAFQGLPLLSPAGLILLKAKAWIDLSTRRKEGHHVDLGDIKKHRNDVFRLALLLTQERTLAIPKAVHRDLCEFLGNFPADSPDWAGIRHSSGAANRMPPPAELLGILMRHFAAAT